MDKAQSSFGFKQILTLVVFIALALFGTIAIVNIFSSMKDAEVVLFLDQLMTDIEVVKTSRSATVNTYTLPNSVDSLLFIDRSYKDILLEEDVITYNPVILDSLTSEQDINLFVLGRNGEVIRSANIGNVNIRQFRGTGCLGLAHLNSTFGSVELPLSLGPGGSLNIGDECDGLFYKSFTEPFDSDIFDTMDEPVYGELSANNRRIMIRENAMTGTGTHFDRFNFTLPSSDRFFLRHTSRIDRIHYNGLTPSDSQIKFRIGFMNSSGDVGFFGPNISANSEDDEGYFYTTNGQRIIYPSEDSPYANFIRMDVGVYMFASSDLRQTPELYGVHISYFKRMSENLCRILDNVDLGCSILDFYLSGGWHFTCCDDYNLLCELSCDVE